MYEQIDAYVRELIERSTPQRTVWNVERLRQGKPADWNYIDGCMLTALLSMAEITGDSRYFDFTECFLDSFIEPDGTIRTYDGSKHSLDDINEGRVLFQCHLLRETLPPVPLPKGEGGRFFMSFSSLCLPLWGRCHAVTEGVFIK
ncbi:MAG: glycoside hydrolase family 88 protein, partial [Oscillibacter sp.]|nr:glycoside hydrolase family 88 protein [Oscillibacter sp.]